MNYIRPRGTAAPTAHARATFSELDRRVNTIFAQVQAWRGWTAIIDPEATPGLLLAVAREIFHAVEMYQAHTTEAGFHMFGRLPKGEVKLIQALCNHKAIEAEHGLWAAEDRRKLSLGGIAEPTSHASPATFAVAAVWWRIAKIEEPLGYLGAEYLFEQLTALVTGAVLKVIEDRRLPAEGLRFIVEHATEDEKHATFLRHLILNTVTRYPDSADAMLRCFDYFHAVYPIPVWEEAYLRALNPVSEENG